MNAVIDMAVFVATKVIKELAISFSESDRADRQAEVHQYVIRPFILLEMLVTYIR